MKFKTLKHLLFPFILLCFSCVNIDCTKIAESYRVVECLIKKTFLIMNPSAILKY